MTEEKSQKESQSIYTDKELWAEAKRKAGDAGISLVVSKLLKKWLKKEVTITLEPED